MTVLASGLNHIDSGVKEPVNFGKSNHNAKGFLFLSLCRLTYTVLFGLNQMCVSCPLGSHTSVVTGSEVLLTSKVLRFSYLRTGPEGTVASSLHLYSCQIGDLTSLGSNLQTLTR